MIRVLFFTATVAALLWGCCGSFDHKNYVIGNGVKYSLYMEDAAEVVATEDIEDEEELEG